ncbi:hypothetical protein [Mesobacillus selenatarsenatis]|uniref:Uncharacterized protein n=1 Tax=Mesobacillus selenatarsenatis (strain DSM 18680 / JCM 14380 / FERM P-15431 / SF-1) TaxID=1321606 RepID=A0A0A8X7V3_MESS1|nr:hypothetical protein [Mesobacillus selenatarsenatis]GAM15122.1 hypothetical protein SAMD00020551_3278 [Mesobacillus selenatarsenatis SF-1]
MAAIIYNVILIASFLFLVWKKDDAEPYFPLKILGYFLLGSFAFNLNQVSLPLGFILYLLFFRPKLNAHVKRMAAVLGVFSFVIVHWIFPFGINQWENRSIYIAHELDSVYTMNFQDEYELIKKELNLENDHSKLEGFEMRYHQDGRIAEIKWQLIRQEHNSYYLYQIRYDFHKSRYQVVNGQSDTWFQYDRLIDADHFFENLNVLDMKDLTQKKGSFSSYAIQSSGERVLYSADLRTHYYLLNGETKLLTNDQLPVEGYVISTFAMKKTEEEKDQQGNIIHESFEGTESADYLFDVYFGDQ